MRFRRLPWDGDRVLVSSMAGYWLTMPAAAFQAFVSHELTDDSPYLADLQARHLAAVDVSKSSLAPLLSQYRSRKSYLIGGPALRTFVASLRRNRANAASLALEKRIAANATTTAPVQRAARRRHASLRNWPAECVWIRRI